MSGSSKSRIMAEVDFDKDGRQHGFLRLFHSVHSSAYGFIPIPIVVLKNGDGPTALLVSGTHGDDRGPGGAVQPGEIAGSGAHPWPGDHPAGGQFSCALAGRRTSPIDEGNLNRLFPGDADGTVTQQIAYHIEHELVPMADLVCDLHSGGSSLMYVPSALFGTWRRDGSTAAGVAALKAFGSPIAYVAEESQGGNRTLSGGAARHGVISLGTEAGGSGHVTQSALRMVERGVNNVLVHMGILPAGAGSHRMSRRGCWRSAGPTTLSTRRRTGCSSRWWNSAIRCARGSRRRASTCQRRRGPTR